MNPAMVEVVPVSRTRHTFLDFVRGVAALCVILQHAVGHLWPDFNEFRRTWFDLGNFGVVIFFLASGFIIPESLHRGGSVQRFWLGRFFRLYPLYWLSLALALVYHLGGYPPGHEDELTFRTNIGTYTLVNATMLQQFVRVPHAITPYWTLSLELIFYVSCTLLFVVGARDSVRIAYFVILAGALLGIVVPLGTGHRVPIGMIFFLMTMFAGTVLFRYQSGEVSGSRCISVFFWLAFVATVGVGINSVILRSANPHANTAFSLGLTWIAGFLFFLWAFYQRDRSFPGVWLWLGGVSYSMYLMHHFVLYVLFSRLHESVPRPLALVVIVCASLALAMLSYRFVERPGIRLGRLLQGSRTNRPRATVGYPSTDVGIVSANTAS